MSKLLLVIYSLFSTSILFFPTFVFADCTVGMTYCPAKPSEDILELIELKLSAGHNDEFLCEKLVKELLVECNYTTNATSTFSNPTTGIVSKTIHIYPHDSSQSHDKIKPEIMYLTSEYSATISEPVDLSLMPISTGGSIVNCISSPALPPGLTLEKSTCRITGIPTTAQDPISYQITASNAAGNANPVILQIGVHYCSVTLSSNTIYSTSDVYANISSKGISRISYSCNGDSEVDILTSTGKPILNTSTSLYYIGKIRAGTYSCVIKGIPTLNSSKKVNCSTPNPLNFTVQNYSRGIPYIKYAKIDYSFNLNERIPAITPENLGGVIQNCNISPALPTGLYLNKTTCTIYGTPTEKKSIKTYSISASNRDGYAKAVNINIGVHFCSLNLSSIDLDTATDVLVKASSLGMSKLSFSCNGHPDSEILSLDGKPVLNTGYSPLNIGKLPAGEYSCLIKGTPSVIDAEIANCTSPNPVNFTVKHAITGTIQTEAPDVNSYLPAISYSKSDYSFERNVAISPLTPINKGGSVTNCLVSPALPSGLKLNSTTCEITGTPTLAQAPSTYKITASNSTGSAMPVNLRIGVHYCSFSLSSTIFNSTTDVLLNATSSGMSKLTYSCNGSPDADFVSSTGAYILNTGSTPFNVGKLTAGSYSCVFKGATSVNINQIVNCTAPNPINFTVTESALENYQNPPSISYAKTDFSFDQGVSITPLIPSNNGGTVSNCIVSPSLPSGLKLNTSTCEITGSPNIAQSLTTYKITASNTAGIASPVSIRIGVHFCSISLSSTTLDTSMDVLLKASSTGMSKLTYSCNGNPEADFISSSGTPVLNTGSSPYNVGKLPSGNYSCVFRGVAALNSNQRVNCLAPNPINFTVKESLPSLSYSQTEYSFDRNVAIAPVTPSNSGGAITNCIASPSLPYGLKLNSSTCEITGTPSTGQAPIDYKITASNSSGSASSINLRIAVHYCSISLSSTFIKTTTDVLLNVASTGMSKLTYSCNGNPESDFLSSSGIPVLNTSSSPYNVGKLPVGSYSCIFRGVTVLNSSQKVNCTVPNPINFQVNP